MNSYQTLFNLTNETTDSFSLSTGASADYILKCVDSTGLAAWVDPATIAVSSIKGTANEILVNGTYGSKQTGDITLTLPSSIDVSTLPNVSTIGTSGTVSILNKLLVGTSYSPLPYTALFTSSSATAIWIDAPVSTISNVIWSKNGTAIWQNYVPAYTNDIRWFNVYNNDAMTLTAEGELTVSSVNATITKASQPNITTLGGLTSIQGQTISSNVWQYVATMDQNVSTTSKPAFNNVTINNVTPSQDGITINYTASAPAKGLISFKTGGLHRWQWMTSGTENGGNAGSNLYLQYYDDSGTLIDNLLSLNRSTGSATFSSDLTLNGHFNISSVSYTHLTLPTKA